jgi:hypothetical protein
MTMKSLILVCGIVVGTAVPATVSAQNPSTTLVTVPGSAYGTATGKATDTTDKIGQKRQPAQLKHVATPRSTTHWHIPLPHLHHRR